MTVDEPRQRDVEFYFDFISPYAYLAFDNARATVRKHGRRITWKPFRLGVTVVKVMGLRPMLETPLKADYVRRDVARLATALGLPFASEGPLPAPMPPALLFYSSPADMREELAHALLRARWAEGRDIGAPHVLEQVGREVGLEEGAVRDALDGAQARECLSATTREAIARGIFGSPTIAVGAELFWGGDRLWLLDHYLGNGETYRQLGQSWPGQTVPIPSADAL